MTHLLLYQESCHKGLLSAVSTRQLARSLGVDLCVNPHTIGNIAIFPYRAMGSGLASNPIKEIAEDEPFDLQMICPVKD